MDKRVVVLAVLTACILLTTCVYAEVPHLIRFQGKVTDTAGAPLNGAYNITFRLYDADTGGTLLWSETQSTVPVNNGIFTTLLGNVTALDLPFDQPYWLSMEVNNDGEMTPRQQISAVGYAIHAETAERFINQELVPQGAIIIWRGSTCPAGYSRVTELDGKFLVSGATYNAAAGGSNTHTHDAGSYQGPSHTHTYSGTTTTPSGTTDKHSGGNSVARWNHTHDYSGTTSASGTGAVTGTSAEADSRPEFAAVILCEKD